MTRRAVYQVDGTIALVGSWGSTNDWWREWQHDWDYVYGAMIAKPKEKKMSNKKYDWSKLQHGWKHCCFIDDPKGHFIYDGCWRYYIKSGEFVRVATGSTGDNPADAIKLYESAYSAVRDCVVSWKDSLGKVIVGTGVTLCFEENGAFLRTHDEFGGIWCAADFTFRLTSNPSKVDTIVALGKAIENLRANGWTHK